MIEFVLSVSTLRHRLPGDVCSQTELLPRDLRSSQMLRMVDWQLVTDVSVQPIGTIFNDKAVEKECIFFDYFTLEDGIDISPRKVGN
jgi:hypothetical protein